MPLNTHVIGIAVYQRKDKKSPARHAKAMVIDGDKVFIGSANLVPRSLRLNTEKGLLVYSEALNAAVRSMVERDSSQANAWHLRFDEDGSVIWVSGNAVLTSQSAESFMQRIEDWFFMLLPIADEMQVSDTFFFTDMFRMPQKKTASNGNWYYVPIARLSQICS